MRRQAFSGMLRAKNGTSFTTIVSNLMDFFQSRRSLPSYQRIPSSAIFRRGNFQPPLKGQPHAKILAAAGSIALVEDLEERRLMSYVTQAGPMLLMVGNTSTANTISMKLDTTGTKLQTSLNGQIQTFDLSQLSVLRAFGGNANDTIYVDPRIKIATYLQGGDGNDTIDGGSGTNQIYGGYGNDLIRCPNGINNIFGEAGNDTIISGAGSDSISGGDGDDSIVGGDGNDTLLGGAGNDTIDGGTGSDVIDGGTGINSLITNSTTSTLCNGTVTNLSSVSAVPSTPTAPPPVVAASPTAPQPVIQFISSSVMAGTAINVQAVSSTLGIGTPLTARYQWDFGDPAGAHNSLDGFNAAHIYDTPGQYTLTLTLTNQAGEKAVKTAQVNVAADTRRTIYVNNFGSDSNTGLSSDQAVASVSRAMQLAGNNTKILFARSETFNVTQGMTIPYSNVMIGAYGFGDRPVLYYAGQAATPVILTTTTASRNVTIQDLTFNAPGTSYTNVASAIYLGGTNQAVRNNQFLNLDNALNLNATPSGVLIADNIAPGTPVTRSTGTGIHDYFAWVQGSDIVFLNNTVANSGLHNIRLGKGYNRVLLSGNNLTQSNNLTTLDVHDGQYIYIANNSLNNGDLGIGPLGGADGLKDPNYQTLRTSWVVLENNVITNATVNICHRTEHLMFRNNVIKRDGLKAINIDGYNSTFHAGVADISIINNTAINNSARGNFLYVLGDSQLDGSAQITLDNNLYVAPNFYPGQYQTAVVYVTSTDLKSFREIKNNVWNNPSTFSYAHGGFFYVWPTWSNSAGYKTPTQWEAYSQVIGDKYANVTLDIRYSPLNAIAASASQPAAGVFTDMYGNVRPTTGWSAGAVQA